MLLCTTLLLSSAILAQKNVKEITFEGISLASAWNIILKLDEKGYVEDGAERFNGIYYTGLKGKFGPSKDDALVVVEYDPKGKQKCSVTVIIDNPKSTLKTIIIYLEKQFGHLELNKKTGCYEKHINNTSLSVTQEKNSEINLLYMYSDTNKNYKKYLPTSSK